MADQKKAKRAKKIRAKTKKTTSTGLSVQEHRKAVRGMSGMTKAHKIPVNQPSP